jgi:hypothetical protein
VAGPGIEVSVIPAEEGLQIAHECCQDISESNSLHRGLSARRHVHGAGGR